MDSLYSVCRLVLILHLLDDKRERDSEETGQAGPILPLKNYPFMSSSERWFYVDVDYACYAIVSKETRIVKTAPIASWMIGKTLQEIKPFLLQKKARVIELK